MWIHLVLVLTVAACMAVDTEDFKDDRIPIHLQQWARDPKAPKTVLLHQEGPNDKLCVYCMSESLNNCTSVQSTETCGANYTCYTLQAFSVANSLTIFAKGCFPEFLCLLNQGCTILNETRNGTIESCSFTCCYTDRCNREPDVPSTTSPPAPSPTEPVATTGGQPLMMPSKSPSQSPEPSPTRAATPPTATPVPTTPLDCGGPLAGSSGNFTSPGYGTPGHFTQSISCSWTITVSKGSVLVLNFLKIKLEKCCDNLEVKIGGRLVRSISGHWNGRRGGRYGRSPTWSNYWHRYWNRHWSQNAVKIEIKGTGEKISVTFSSNSPVTKSGFFASYKVVTPIVCGGPLTGSFGNFTSPGYPGNYPDNASCTWSLTVSQRYNLKLNFWSLNTERCCDYVKILVGNREVRRLAGTWPWRYFGRYGTHYLHSWSQYGRGKRAWNWHSNGHRTGSRYGQQTWSNYYHHGNAMKLTIPGTGEQISIAFVSDYSITKKGFLASYSVTQGYRFHGYRYYGYYGDETDDRKVKT